ncbi:DUF1681-domain-containing protein [Saitoella complicata NRRL Y-17804]|uniref:NECAP PHear domain-containing protein n=1 Tax=Saitoella complicata (strain BCRC 22490 / CBS 7301 / JCM 7358 / NBRC 10748 / NRRL Y-17804) TaxID=698492 RepID=A0A0E9NIA1_SAICN|nr:DUF1681-domain-containing protein [Saitoella complicata NRRL Y-17804]ODQ52155.1 DUF1681-domain-containing protein [Saitoella complicata NRRL Y-17804]GAO49538.1 hypothetical protein G7K_3687-t1 [Saitoella complicata NRRL Y-17804]
MAEDSYESVLFIAKEVSVYRIPPRQSSKGHKASDWDAPRSFLWSGRLRVIERTPSSSSGPPTCVVLLEDPNTGELFAACPYTGPHSVEQVLDSSRYFVVTVEDAGRRAWLGLGFSERSEAFDFNVALQDFARHSKPVTSTPSASAAKKDVPPPPPKDYSLKEGQTINISIGDKGRRSRPSKPSPSGSSGSTGAIPFLPPPPSADQVRAQKAQNGSDLLPLPPIARQVREEPEIEVKDSAVDLGFDDDFGEFQ